MAPWSRPRTAAHASAWQSMHEGVLKLSVALALLSSVFLSLAVCVSRFCSSWPYVHGIVLVSLCRFLRHRLALSTGTRLG